MQGYALFGAGVGQKQLCILSLSYAPLHFTDRNTLLFNALLGGLSRLLKLHSHMMNMQV